MLASPTQPDITASASGRCPVDHGSHKKTVSMPIDPSTVALSTPPMAPGTPAATRRSGQFCAATAPSRPASRPSCQKIPQTMNTPILYQEGKAHHTQRQQTARFFTPKAVSTNYRQLMETYADQLMVALGRHKCVDLSEMSMRMAVSVAAEVVGLTDSYWPRMDRRLDAFFENVPAEVTWTPSGILNFPQRPDADAEVFSARCLPRHSGPQARPTRGCDLPPACPKLYA